MTQKNRVLRNDPKFPVLEPMQEKASKTNLPYGKNLAEYFLITPLLIAMANCPKDAQLLEQWNDEVLDSLEERLP